RALAFMAPDHALPLLLARTVSVQRAHLASLITRFHSGVPMIAECFGSSQPRLEQRRQRVCKIRRLAVFKYCYLSKWSPQIVIIENEYAWEFTNCQLEIRQRSGKTGRQFLGGNIMASLRYTNSNAFF